MPPNPSPATSSNASGSTPSTAATRSPTKSALSSTIIGDAGNDTIIGGSANDTIQAGSGDDHFDGGLGINQIDEGSGNDAFDYSSEPGSEFNIDNFAEASLPSQAISVTRNFGAGEDDAIEQPNLTTFIGTPGNDQVSFRLTDLDGGNGGDARFKFYLGAGNDSATTDAESDPALLVDGGNGNDTIEWNIDSSIVSVLGGAGNDIINDDAGAGAYIDGGSGFDTDNVNPDDEISGNALNDYTVPAGIEKYSVGVQQNLVVHGNGLDNIISAWGANVTVYGNGGNDQITAVAGAIQPNDTSIGHAFLDGGSGNDLLHASATGDSTLKGGDGNDTLIGDGDFNDQEPPANPSFIYQGNGGTDTADFSSATANLNITLDNKANDGTAGQTNNVESDVENVIGGSGDDFLAGNPSNNNLEGGAGNDTLWGGSGNDTLVGYAGHDQLHGQDGNDTLIGKDGQTEHAGWRRWNWTKPSARQTLHPSKIRFLVSSHSYKTICPHAAILTDRISGWVSNICTLSSVPIST